ncbi:BolA family transcriptional regulator [Devosia rhodophyticola]|uniref:BolA family transcriptional regulator n=1 Tax=Devosia rhodophyticola TaxID=3026423 RepID=A0ABY7YUG6_9HYPH|nr:BolA family protein [Devosia rhodophyticola]WDR04690.1 BolA family transcriptional regulator [Devosia rhodophyticola]
MSMHDTIVDKLTAAFDPEILEVIDESNQHFGHAGWQEGGETHFRVRIAARHFAGKLRVVQHRDVMMALNSELKGRLHALTIEIVPVKKPDVVSTPV